MAKLRISFRDKQIGRRYKISLDSASRKIRRAQVLAAEDARNQIVRLGRQDIAQAGNFGSRWTEGLTGEVVREQNDVVINVRHAVPYFPVFQKGRTIHAKRGLLWIPLSHADDAQGVRARDYPGRLFRVDRESGAAPLLISAADKEPKYFGKTSVRIPKKFHVLEIAREVARLIKSFYVKHRTEQ